MRVLHLCSYYIGNKLYKNLIEELSRTGIKQEVFVPIRNRKHYEINKLDKKNVKFYYKKILNKHDKFFYFNKIKKQMEEVERDIFEKNKTIDFIHAHTVFSDGGTAYSLFKKYGVKYVINVRNTDINTFYKYGIHLRPFMYKVLLNAVKIVFISHAYKQKMFRILPGDLISKIEDKCIVIPNGIENYWHDNIKEKKKEISKLKEVKLVFIGTLNSNKNLQSVIYACKMLKNKGYRISLNVIGDGPHEKKLKKLCHKQALNNEVIFHGFLSDKKDVASLLNCSDILVVPSVKETFGLVYIEAMSQGLPVIFTKEQGIDGFFEEGKIGYSVTPYDIPMITKSILKIIENYKYISHNCIRESNKFNWKEISEKYTSIYKL